MSFSGPRGQKISSQVPASSTKSSLTRTTSRPPRSVRVVGAIRPQDLPAGPCVDQRAQPLETRPASAPIGSCGRVDAWRTGAPHEPRPAETRRASGRRTRPPPRRHDFLVVLAVRRAIGKSPVLVVADGEHLHRAPILQAQEDLGHPHEALAIHMLAPHARLRPKLIRDRRTSAPTSPPSAPPPEPPPMRDRYLPWAELMRRTFEVDVLVCPRCSGRMKIIAAITDPDVIRAFLDALGIPREDVTPAPARPPPDPEDGLPLA